MPVTNPNVPPDEWPLGPQGERAARALAVPRGARVITSDERKALETARQLGPATLTVDPRVREARRPHEWRDDFRALARAYVAGTQHDGWEDHARLIARFDAAIRAHR